MIAPQACSALTLKADMSTAVQAYTANIRKVLCPAYWCGLNTAGLDGFCGPRPILQNGRKQLAIVPSCSVITPA